jgi:hypothetical protein
MGTFITQQTTPTLFEDGPKVAAPDQRIPNNLTVDNVTKAADLNALQDGLQDTRTALRAQIVNVKHYDATGDGTTDDRTALNTATAVTGEKFVPAGTYKVGSALAITGVWRFASGATLKPANGVTVTLSSTAVVYASAEWRDTSAGGAFSYTAGSSLRSTAAGKASHTNNIVEGHAGNAVASDVGTCIVAGGGNSGSEQLIGYSESLDRVTGNGVTTSWTTSYAATTSRIFVQLIRADKVRVDVTASCGLVQSGANVQVTYPQVGHFVNDGASGAEGSNAAVLATQQLYISSTLKTAVVGSASDYSSVLDGYDNVISTGVRQTASGAHQRITAGDHNTVFGGSYNRISAGSYGVITGGSANEIGATGSGSVMGGFGNSSSGSGPQVVFGSTHVVSGVASAVLGGSSNTVGANGAIATGRSNTVSAADSFAAGNTNTVGATMSGAFGFSNTMSGTGYSAAFGRSNTVSGGYAAAAGRDNTVSADHSTASGKSAKAALAFAHVIGAEQFAALGDAQSSTVVGRRQTTDATPTEIRLGAATARFTIPNDTTWAFSILVVARRTDADNESAAYKLEGCIDNNATTVALAGTVTKTVLAEDTVAWDCNATADNTNKALSITVTGEAAKTINWVARVTLAEVTG